MKLFKIQHSSKFWQTADDAIFIVAPFLKTAALSFSSIISKLEKLKSPEKLLSAPYNNSSLFMTPQLTWSEE